MADTIQAVHSKWPILWPQNDCNWFESMEKEILDCQIYEIQNGRSNMADQLTKISEFEDEKIQLYST